VDDFSPRGNFSQSHTTFGKIFDRDLPTVTPIPEDSDRDDEAKELNLLKGEFERLFQKMQSRTAEKTQKT
jgi:hypothetical protein